MRWIKAKSVIGVGIVLVTTAMSQFQVYGKETVGVGFSSYLKDERTGTLIILSIAPKSPAAQAGLPLHYANIVRKINDISVANKTMTEWTSVLNGSVGTKVRLELIIDPKGKEVKTVELVSGKYPAPDDQVILKAK